ncbi:MAG: hypothetical protein KGJ35_01280 [Patescibacteria group bacterium]|nr:hypothetical protein [Patescibacteria group bacterium]
MNDWYTLAFIHFIAVAAVAVIVLALLWEILRLFFRLRKRSAVRKQLALMRSEKNPIMSPNRQLLWQLEGTFNPGAILDNEGRIHLFYRAMGSDGISRIGHASSRDGIHFDERSPYPVFVPVRHFGLPDAKTFRGPMTYDPTFYTSGGGWGGAEDPRAVVIDGRIYITYVAFEGWDHVNMAVTSIDERDLKHRRWNWKRPVLLSPKRNKNWVLFPEKINGKFAVIHGLTDHAHIAYTTNIEHMPDVKSMPNRDGAPGYVAKGREKFWDHWTRGAGAPPIRTDRGWLLFYNVVDPRDPGKYKIGAMLLDMNDPSHITHRSPEPLLSPEMHYENDGKPGVVYASGAVVKDGTVFLYYGAGDRHIGLATLPLQTLLEWLEKYGKV